MAVNGFSCVTAGDMRRLEEQVVQSGVSYETLMRRAGVAAAKHLAACCFSDNVSRNVDQTVVIVCGKGNNGGDGFVIAQWLREHFQQLHIHVVLVCGFPTVSPAKDVFEQLVNDDNLNVVSVEGNTASFATFIPKPDIVVDAVYGIGFRGALPDTVAKVFDYLRSFDPFTLAVDIPSGVSADSDAFDKRTLRADHTVTFTAMKPCMAFESARALCGDVTVASVGIADAVVSDYTTDLQVVTKETVCCGFKVRPADAHKGTFGRVFALCGSYGMAGAAMLVGKAALRCGVGLLHLFVPKSIYPIVASQVWEAVFHPLDETEEGALTQNSIAVLKDTLQNVQNERACVLVGPGLSRREQTASLLMELFARTSLPMVVDADGLNCLSEHIDVLKAMKKRGVPLVLTPHPAEAARLLGVETQEIEADRILAAKRLAELCGGVAVLKGHRTIIASASGNVSVNPTGCSGLSTGGSGDVLAGMLAAFIASGMETAQAAVSAVYLHGLSSERVSEQLSQTGMLPTDLLVDLPKLLSQFEKRE